MISFLKMLILLITSLIIGFKYTSLFLASLIIIIWFLSWYLSLTNLNKDMHEEHISEKTAVVLIVLGLFIGSITAFYLSQQESIAL